MPWYLMSAKNNNVYLYVCPYMYISTSRKKPTCRYRTTLKIYDVFMISWPLTVFWEELSVL